MSDDHIYGNQDPIGRAVPVGDLESYIEEMSKRKGGFTDEFSVSSMHNIFGLVRGTARFRKYSEHMFIYKKRLSGLF